MNELLINTWKFLGNVSLVQWIVIIGLPSLITFCFYFNKYLQSQWKFGKNLKRKIYFLKTSESKKLSTEMNQLKNLNLFNLDENIKDISNDTKLLQTMKTNAVYVVGYSEKYNKYEELFDVAVQNNIPIIIFASVGEIRNSEHWKIFNKYIYCDVVNTTNRVAIILINILKIV